MGVASQVRKALKMQLLSLFPLLCIVSAAPEGGLFGFGLLGGDSANTTRHHCQQAPAPPQHHQPPPPTPTTATTAESSRTWSTFSPARLPRLPLTSCPACWALTIRFLLPSVTPLAFSPTR